MYVVTWLGLGDHIAIIGNKCTFVCFYVLSFILGEVVRKRSSTPSPSPTSPPGATGTKGGKWHYLSFCQNHLAVPFSVLSHLNFRGENI